ncbi:MAG: ABC transporter ATP-binding protein/permease [Oscillospiraceae bacterium]|jgi:ATP-binding cassette subfamily B protein|nr:ABC transporter ATP-binding protein/permease [Oscillospiraceae bacterium]
MFGIKKLLRLSEGGYKDMKRGVFAAVLSNLCMFLPFGIAVQVITLLLRPLTDGGTLDTNQLWLWLGAGAGAAVLYFFVYTNEYRKTYTVAYSESEKIRVEVAEKLRRLPLSFFNRRDLSELTTNIMGDCASVEQVMSHVVPGIFATSITITLICALIAFYDWRMALAMFAALPAAFGLIALTKGIQSKYGERHVRAKLDVAEQMQEYLEGVKVVKAFGLAGEKSAALKGALRAMLKEAVRFELIAGVFATLAMMILQVGIGLVTLVGVTLLTGGTLSPIALLMFLIISVKIYSPMIVVLTLLPEFFYMLVSTKRMQALREEAPMTGDEEAELADYTVELKDVSFAYNETDVIRSISLTMPQNSVTALVGPSGSGKTTVARLIARFWDVRAGEIRIGGRNIREIDPERLMSYMSFVFQDVVLFNDTVMNNIRIGKKDATDGEIYAAAKLARCDAFIRAMPQGFETVIGENGSTLSGGERQRISIARALLKNAPIVLLDEATASLDPENETQIQAAISELVKGRTVIVIAHRLRTVVGADKIAVLENGRLVEEGTGEQLLARNGLFARLYQIQQDSLGWAVGAPKKGNNAL